MKHPFVTHLLCLLLSITLIFSGCATTDIQQALPTITSATELACNAVLEFGVMPEEKVVTANYIYSTALCVRSLSGGKVPTVEELSAAIALWSPKGTQWARFATSLSSLYSSQFNRIKGDPKVALEVLEAIAQGCENAAADIHTN